MRLRVAWLAIGILNAAALMAAGVSVTRQAERKKAPEFELKDSAGNVVRLSDFGGKVVLIDFWATWCAPCKADTPWLIELAEKYRADGLVVLGVAMENEWPSITEFVEKMGVTYPVVKGNKRVAYLYGDVEALPVTFFVDREQRVAASHMGAANRKQYEEIVRRLLKVE